MNNLIIKNEKKKILISYGEILIIKKKNRITNTFFVNNNINESITTKKHIKNFLEEEGQGILKSLADLKDHKNNKHIKVLFKNNDEMF